MKATDPDYLHPIKKAAKMNRRARKRARKVAARQKTNVVEWTIAEHLFENRLVASPAIALVLAHMIAASIRPLIIAEYLHVHPTPETPASPKETEL